MTQLMPISDIEYSLLKLLMQRGSIRGTAQVGFALWPDRRMQAQGAAVAAGNVLSRLRDRKMVRHSLDERTSTYTITGAGRRAITDYEAALIDPRQLALPHLNESEYGSR